MVQLFEMRLQDRAELGLVTASSQTTQPFLSLIAVAFGAAEIVH